MFGMVNLPPGRMGNKFLQYNFLRQVATRAGVDYFHPLISELAFCENMEARSRSLFRRKVNQLLKGDVAIVPLDVFNATPTEFLNFIESKSQMGCDILLEGSFILEPFWNYLFYDPNDFIKIKKDFAAQYAIPHEENKTIVGIHFRGTDFYSFDKKAVLDFCYYQKAILFCLDYFKGTVVEISLFSEDFGHETCPKILSFLRSLNVGVLFAGDKNSSSWVDLYRLSQCDVIISSPSTYAIVAGYLVKNKKIIHSAAWLDHAIDVKKLWKFFWRDLIKSQSPYYSLWKTF